MTKLDYSVYAVVNGSNILQIGHGSGKRASLVMRGSLACKHNKAFICSIAEAISGAPNDYFALAFASKDEASKVEKQLHQALGIRTNQDGATVIGGIDCSSIESIHVGLWRLFRQNTTYRALNDGERALAEQLFEIVTFAKTKVTRTSKTVSSVQGDNLEGNILMRINRAHVIPIYQKITNSYHRYGVHCPSDAEMSKILSENPRYTPRGERFEIVADGINPVFEHLHGNVLRVNVFGFDI